MSVVTCVRCDVPSAVVCEGCGAALCEGHARPEEIAAGRMLGYKAISLDTPRCQPCYEEQVVLGWRGLSAVICLLIAVVAPLEGHWEAVPVCVGVFAAWWGFTAVWLKGIRESKRP